MYFCMLKLYCTAISRIVYNYRKTSKIEKKRKKNQ